MKYLEMIAVNFLLKRGYQITFPTITFSEGNDKYFYTKTDWKGK